VTGSAPSSDALAFTTSGEGAVDAALLFAELFETVAG
jgi:hypothetical protein